MNPTTQPPIKSSKRKAFALVLAIAAMAFMVLLTLTLSSVITAKLRLINAQKEIRAARSNAVLGMSVALSQLQRTLGKDNAISIPATLLDSDPETLEIEEVISPYIVGAISVEKESSSLSSKDLQDEQTEIFQTLRDGGSSDSVTWFVSGQKQMKNPKEENVADLSSETVSLAEFNTLANYPSSFGSSINSTQKSEKIQVRAGKVDIDSADMNSTGSYAWWVSDESMKAKVNLQRPKRYLSEGMGEIGKAPADTRIPQISNTSFVDELADLGLNPFTDSFQEEVSNDFAKATSLEELAIVDTNLSQWAKQNKNDWTANSVGIPVDVTQGRLKEDLTAYIQSGVGPEDKEVMVRGNRSGTDKDYTGPKFGITDFSTNLPRFGNLKTWAQIARDANSEDFDGQVDVMPPSIEAGSPQHGIYPLISRVNLFFMPAYYMIESDQEDLWNTKSRVGMTLVMWPKITLWNPHNVKLRKTSYVIRVYAPLQFLCGLTRSTGFDVKAKTSWAKLEIDSTTGQVANFDSNTTSIATVEYVGSTATPHFSSFIKNRAENSIPLLTFQVKDLDLRPGETVQLVVSPNASRGASPYNATFSSMAEYKDVENPSGQDNLLEPGYYETTVGLQDLNVKTGMGMRLTMTKADSEDLILNPQKYSDTLLQTAQRNGDEEYLTATDSGGKKYAFKPVSHITQLNVGSWIGNTSRPYLQSWWIINGEASTLSPRSYSRIGHELIKQDGFERLYQFDLTEWSSQNAMSTVTNKTNYRHDAPIRGFHRNNVANNFSWNYGFNIDENKYETMLINRIETLYSATMTPDELENGKLLFVFKGSKSGGDYGKTFREGGAKALGYKIQDLNATDSPVFTGGNIRASSLKSSRMDNSAAIKRVESPDGARKNYGVAREVVPLSKSADIFFGKAYGKGEPHWPLTQNIPGGMLRTDDLMRKYSSGDNTFRIGSNVILGGNGGYGADHPICALFEYPRSPHDLMSLGMLSHMDFSPMPWFPTWQFGQSFASPFMDRDVIYEKEKVNANEILDISYILNASIWDRFYMSSIIPSEVSGELKAGMRLPNTRYFIKNLPKNKSELYGSEDAYKKSAAYVGVDGAFNVNTTSYEAWRAFLGGMLGTQKKTLTGETINKDGNDPSNSETFRMPNPGSMNPIALPANEDDSKSSLGSYIYYTYKDMMVGRTISEAEIDQLAREIVAEVKRRAPFFSLGDFVNRRLVSFEDGTSADIVNKKYQGLMGTIAAAIHRSTQDNSRPSEFFGSKNHCYFISSQTVPSENSYVRAGTMITVYDNSHNGSSLKDLGEHVKDDKVQYKEQAFLAPIGGSSWNSRVAPAPGMLNQRDILSMIGPFITVRGDTFTIRAYGESKNPMTGTTSKAYCEAIVQRSSDPVDGSDDIVAPESPFGRRFNVVSFRWLTPAEL